MFLRRKPVDSKWGMNKRIVQHNNNGSNKNEDNSSLNESVSAGQDEVYIINDIINNNKYPQKMYPHTNCKWKIMIILLTIYKIIKIIRIRRTIIHRTIVIHLFNRKVTIIIIIISKGTEKIIP